MFLFINDFIIIDCGQLNYPSSGDSMIKSSQREKVMAAPPIERKDWIIESINLIDEL